MRSVDPLEISVGLCGTVQTFSSLNNRRFTVHIGLHSSSSIKCGVPQGSILGPLLFSFYMLPLVSMFNNYIVSLIH